MGEDELRVLIKRKIAEAGLAAPATPKDIGKMMGLVMAEAKGRADGAVVKKIIEEKLK